MTAVHLKMMLMFVYRLISCKTFSVLGVSRGRVYLTQRVQIPNILRAWFQNPTEVWHWGSDTSNTGCLGRVGQLLILAITYGPVGSSRCGRMLKVPYFWAPGMLTFQDRAGFGSIHLEGVGTVHSTLLQINMDLERDPL